MRFFDRLRAAVAAFIAPTTPPTPTSVDTSADNSIGGDVSGTSVQARTIDTVSMDTHTHTHHDGNHLGDVVNSSVVQAQQVQGPILGAGVSTGDLVWGNSAPVTTGHTPRTTD